MFKLNAIVFALLFCGYFTSCDVSNVDTAPIDHQERAIPAPIGEVDGLPIYESGDFLENLENPENLTYPILIESEESEYMVQMDDSEYEEGLRIGSGGAYGVRLNNPFVVNYAETRGSDWVPPSHHTPWNGHWASDFWRKNGTCSKNVYMHAQLYNVNGHHFDSLIGKVEQEGNACASGVEADGGHMQKIGLYGVKNGTKHYLGWVIYAHIEDSSFKYEKNDEFNICTYPHRGVVHLGKIYNGWETECEDKDGDGHEDCCSQSCHLHFEMGSFGWSHYHVSANNNYIAWSHRVGSGYRWLNL